MLDPVLPDPDVTARDPVLVLLALLPDLDPVNARYRIRHGLSGSVQALF